MKKQREAHWVEVKNNNYTKYEKRIAVDLECNPVLCVDLDFEEKYLNFEHYDVEWWDQWREIKEPEWVPYETMEECFNDLKKDQFMIKRKEYIYCVAVACMDDSGCRIYDDLYSFKQIFNYYTKLDGTPCGKLKELK